MLFIFLSTSTPMDWLIYCLWILRYLLPSWKQNCSCFSWLISHYPCITCINSFSVIYQLKQHSLKIVFTDSHIDIIFLKFLWSIFIFLSIYYFIDIILLCPVTFLKFWFFHFNFEGIMKMILLLPISLDLIFLSSNTPTCSYLLFSTIHIRNTI